MKTFASLSALVMGLALVGTAQATPNPDAQSMPPPHTGGMTSNQPRSAADASENPRVVTGRVVNVDAQQGTLVIQTPLGVIALRGPSEDLRQVSVGDIVEVEMVGDDNAPSASPMNETGNDQ
jgi:hypothetical protein